MARRKPLPLSWSPVPGATSYRVRIVPADHPNDDTVYDAPYDEIDALPLVAERRGPVALNPWRPTRRTNPPPR